MESLSTTIEAKDEYTRGHSRRVAQYAALIAKNMGWTNEEIQNLKNCAYLHDIGKIGIPDQILNKPGQEVTMNIMMVLAIQMDLKEMKFQYKHV